MSSFRRKTTS